MGGYGQETSWWLWMAWRWLAERTDMSLTWCTQLPAMEKSVSLWGGECQAQVGKVALFVWVHLCRVSVRSWLREGEYRAQVGEVELSCEHAYARLVWGPDSERDSSGIQMGRGIHCCHSDSLFSKHLSKMMCSEGKVDRVSQCPLEQLGCL